MGLGGAYGISADGVARAYERGLNYFFWSPDWGGMTEGLRRLIPSERDSIVIACGTRQRNWPEVEGDLERYLQVLGTDHLDVFQLSVMEPSDEVDRLFASGGVIEQLQRARDSGRIRAIGVSVHDRPLARKLAETGALDVMMLRYNCAHRGIEEEVLPYARAQGCGVVAFTALRWGTLLQRPPAWPEGRSVPEVADFYRFVLHNPDVDLVLTGPRTVEQLEENLEAAEEGPPLTEERYAWLKEYGDMARQTPVPAFR